MNNDKLGPQKRCVGCGNYLPTHMYYASTQNEDGLNRYCKQCCKVNRALEAVRKRDKKSKIGVRQKQRAMELGVDIEDGITLVTAFKTSRGICGICGVWVKPKHASMDHTVPLSRGGHHIHANIQIVHLECNLRKGNKLYIGEKR